MSTPVYCETAELAVEATSIAEGVGLAIDAQVVDDPLESAARAALSAPLALALCLHVPEPVRAIAALHVCSDARRLVISAISEREPQAFGFACDLGFVCLREVAPAIAALALLAARAERPWRANSRKLSSADHARLARVLAPVDRHAGRFLSEGGSVHYQRGEQGGAQPLGSGAAVAEALRALQACARLEDQPVTFASPEDASASRDVLFGPPRVLSDPASKAALLPFELPLPQEELCSSASRASAEAARIGFPVRISLASPDLRVWDHPELSVDGVDNAARVRDIYRQLLNRAQELTPDARVLGVTVTATTLARALLRVSARPLPHGRVLLRVGFSDPHGATAKDAITTALPASPAAIERALGRLVAAPLLWSERAPARERDLAALSQLFSSIGSFVDSFRAEVARVELHPVALLVGGGAEIREAAIEVTDIFVRELG